MRRRFVTVVIASLALACNGASQPQVHVMDMSCGAVIGELHGNAQMLFQEELARRREQKKDPFAVYPQMVVRESAVWKSVTRLRVRFMDGDAPTRAFVMGVAKEWLAGLRLNFLESSDLDAEIRVTFAGNGVWSKVGKSALSVPHTSATMGLGALLLSSDSSLRRAYVLHEFGHALGALHEHQRLKARLTWVPEVLYPHYLKLYGWSPTQVQKEVILPLEYEDLFESDEFDRDSVMMYPILKEFTKEGFVQPWNSQLTDWDRAVMASLYK